MPLSRRDFIRISVGGTVVTIGGLRAGPVPAFATSAAGATPGQGTLVVLTLYGGNDALNTVAPLGDARYASLRADLAIDPTTAHDLGDGYALHPSLAGCKQLWDDQKLAIVHGVGFATLDRSHFHCMDVWQAASEHDHTSGWIGRWLDAATDDPLAALNVGSTLPLAMRGSRRYAAVVPSSGGLELPGDGALRAAVTSMMTVNPDDEGLGAAVASSTTDLFDVVDRVGPSLDTTPPAEDTDAGDGTAAMAANREDSLASQLDVVAALIEAGLPTRVYGVSIGSFDTHANQSATHQQLLTDVDGGLSSFIARMGARPVTVLVYSEFGRRVAPNGSGGTDHGSAGTVLLAGKVSPGFHGEPSPLDQLVDGDLATTTDFRAVYAGVLEGVLGIDAADVMDDPPSALAVV